MAAFQSRQGSVIDSGFLGHLAQRQAPFLSKRFDVRSKLAYWLSAIIFHIFAPLSNCFTCVFSIVAPYWPKVSNS
jgi:hypothetical protein